MNGANGSKNLFNIREESEEHINPDPSLGQKRSGSMSDLEGLSRDSDRIDENDGSCEPELNTFTLYLIRHGEALHNVLEKAAAKKAKDLAVSQGHAPDSDETKARMEEARMGVLDDPSLLDAPLTETGKEEASGAHRSIQSLVEDGGLPPPTEVFVSPLQRALQTANIVFPDHGNVIVRKDLRERQTLKAADTRSPCHVLRDRPSFRHFCMKSLRDESMKNMELALYEEYFGQRMDWDERTVDLDIVGDGEAEDKAKLRVRTKLLFDMLSESKHRDLAIVGHKGYLRELERGPFGQTKAKEFKNCEVRVYRVTFYSGSRVLEAIERIG